MDDLKKVNEALKDFLNNAKQKNSGQDRAAFVGEVSREVMNIFAPVLQEMANNSKINKDELASVLREIQVAAPEVQVPEIRIPDINVPTPQVTVHVPKADTPNVTVTPTPVNFPSEMSLKAGNKPFPVIMMDQAGKPMMFPMPESAGPGFPMAAFDPSSNAIKVSGSFSVTASNSSTQAIDSSGNPYSQANPFPVVFGSSGTTASNIVDSSGVAYSGSNPVPVVITSGASATSASNIVDSSGVAYSGSNPVPVTGTVAVSGVTGSIGATILNGEGVARDTWGSSQVGTWNITTLTGITNTVASMDVDSTGIAYSGSNPRPITGTVVASGITASIQSALIDSTGVQYSGSNPVPVLVTGTNGSTSAVLTRQTNPTAVAADFVPVAADDLGRTITRPVQVRDLTITAYASLTNGTETTLLAGSAGFFHDLVYVMGANNSDVAVTVDLRPVTAGNTVLTLQVPANGTAGIACPVPLPQSGSDTGNNWTADMGDITGTTVYLTALFSREV